MKAAWDWHLSRTTKEEQRQLVAFTHQVGFDTLIIHEPTPAMMDAAADVGIKVVAIVTPSAMESFAESHPTAIQQALPAEATIAQAAHSLGWDSYTIGAHRWFPIVQMGQTLCFEDPIAQKELKSRVEKALDIADGVAFDGFGFLNHYACHCDGCQQIRQQNMAESSGKHEAQALAEMSEESLVDISHILYAHAKSIKKDALVTNHLWPPFRPNPSYGHRLKLDYCSQTISWFYKPNWSLDRVEFEASEMKKLEDPTASRFAPFIAMFNEPYLLRSAGRIEQELAIAKKYGDGHLIFCNLEVLWEHDDIRQVVRNALKD